MKFIEITFTGAVLQSASRSNTRVPWADHRRRACGWVGSSNPPACLPTREWV